MDSKDSTSMVVNMLEQGKTLKDIDEDSSLIVLLNAVDYSKGCSDARVKYELFKYVSQLYEKKNLSVQQQKYQMKMVDEARVMKDKHAEAEAYRQMAITSMVMGKMDKAIAEAKKSMQLANTDSVRFKSDAWILISQIYLQKGAIDSMNIVLDKAVHLYPKIIDTEGYKLSRVYAIYGEGNVDNVNDSINEYAKHSSIHLRAELVRLRMGMNEEAENWHEAYDDASELLTLTDSISIQEQSSSMARIHDLQHEQQMERNHAERLAERMKLLTVIICILCLLLIISIFALLYRKRAIMAHARELEAMRLADEAQTNEAVTREENIQLHKLYYEHLYAIILPILNARRGKTGHIDLEESSWKLIESNTDMVLPGFTSKLRRSHPSLSVEDIRFCCLLMMRVPNAILADVYGIANSSVAIKKQRMKKKLDSDIHEQTIEEYLNKYMI